MSWKATLEGNQVKQLKAALVCFSKIGKVSNTVVLAREAYSARQDRRCFRARTKNVQITIAGSELLIEALPSKVCLLIPMMKYSGTSVA